MKINKLTETNVERLIDVFLDPGPEGAKSIIARIREARDEANASIEKQNQREDALNDWEVSLSTADQKYDTARADITQGKRELEQERELIKSSHAQLEERTKQIAATEASLVERERQATAAVANADVVQKRADDLSKAANAKMTEANALMAELKEREVRLRSILAPA